MVKNNNGFIKSLVFQEMPSEVCDVKGKSLILYSVHDVSANRVMVAKCCVVTECFFLKHGRTLHVVIEYFFLKHFRTLHVVIEYFSLKHGRTLHIVIKYFFLKHFCTLHTAVGLGLKALLSLPVKPTSHPPLANLTRRPLKDDNVE